MVKRHIPPGRTSMDRVVLVKPFGPSQCTRCSGSVHARKTSSRGASNTRVMTISRSAVSGWTLGLGHRGPRWQLGRPPLLGLQLAQVLVQPVEALFPELAVALQPVGHVLERRGLQPARPPLGLAALGDQPGALEHLEVLGDGRQAHARTARPAR